MGTKRAGSNREPPVGKGQDAWWMLADLLCESNFLIDKRVCVSL